MDTVIPKSKSSRFRDGVIASAGGTVVSAAAGLLLLPLIIHRIGAGQYGLWLLLSTAATYLYQADLGLGAGLIHFLSKHRGDSIEQHRRIVMTSLVSMTVGGACAIPVYTVVAILIVNGRAAAAHVSAGDSRALALLGGFLIANLGAKTFSSTMQGYGYWVFQRQTWIAGSVIRILGTVAACVLRGGVVSVAVVETIVTVAPMYMCMWKCVRLGLIGSPRLCIDRALRRNMLSYSRRAFVVGAMGMILLQADTLIVGLVASAAAVTYYGAAFRIYNTVVQAVGWLTDPLMPAMSQLYRADAGGARRLFMAMLFATLWGSVGVAGSLMLACPGVFPFWLGRAAPTSTLVAVLCSLLTAQILSSVHEPAIPAADASGSPGAFANLYICWALSNLVVSVVGGYAIGAVGVAIGTALPLVVLEPLFVARISQRLGISANAWLRQCLLPVLALGLSATAFSGTALGILLAVCPGRVAWIAAGLSYGVVYSAASWKIRARLPLNEMRHLANAKI